ncbi:MAG: YdcF family protein [Candidatus Nanopelagicales bacterium]
MGILLVVMAAVMLVGMLAAGQVVSAARQYDDTRTDAIVVLGASQYWGKPSPVLANRLDYAARLYADGVAPMIVTVGGGIPGDRTTEAEAGAAYLQSVGVPASAILAVPRGRDTVASMEAVANKAEQAGWTSLTVVSDRAHLARSAAILEALGITAHTNGPASGDGSLLTPEYVARESAGLIRFQVWDRWHLTT